MFNIYIKKYNRRFVVRMSSIKPNNYYQLIPSKFKSSTKNVSYPNYNKIKIDLPMRMLIIGTSGSGKSNALIDMIMNINAWPKIYLFAKNLKQPLYDWLIAMCDAASEKIGEQILFVSENTDEIPIIE